MRHLVSAKGRTLDTPGTRPIPAASSSLAAAVRVFSIFRYSSILMWKLETSKTDSMYPS